LPNIVATVVLTGLGYFSVISDHIEIGNDLLRLDLLGILVGYPLLLFGIDLALRYTPIARFPNGSVLMDRLFFNWVDLVFLVALEFLLGYQVHAKLDKRFYFVYLVGWVLADLIGLYAGAWVRFGVSCVWPLISVIFMVLSQRHGAVVMVAGRLVGFGISQGWATEMGRKNRITESRSNVNRTKSGVVGCVLAYLVPIAYPIYYFLSYKGQRGLLLSFSEYYGQSTIMAPPPAESGSARDIVDDETPKGKPSSSPPPQSIPPVSGGASSSTPSPSASKVPEKKGAVKESPKRLEKDLGVSDASTITSGLCALAISAVLLVAL